MGPQAISEEGRAANSGRRDLSSETSLLVPKFVAGLDHQLMEVMSKFRIKWHRDSLSRLQARPVQGLFNRIQAVIVVRQLLLRWENSQPSHARDKARSDCMLFESGRFAIF